MNEHEQSIVREAARIRSALRKRATKTCPVCNTSFEALKTQEYCSDKCRQRSRAGSPNQTIKICPACGKETQGQRSNAVFCSDACRRKTRYEEIKRHRPPRPALLTNDVLEDLRNQMRQEILNELGIEDPQQHQQQPQQQEIEELS